MSTTCNLLSNNSNIIPKLSIEQPTLNSHALIGISTFNSYFSIENMQKLFLWANNNFIDFHIFLMDGASIHNLMAIGYSEHDALRKTRRNDRNLYNKVVKSLNSSIGLSLKEAKEKVLLLSITSKDEKYLDVYKKCLEFFEQNSSFRNDCLDATRIMLSDKIDKIDENALYLAVKYLLAELPLWFNTPYIFNIQSSVVVYKDLSLFWEKICYNYGLMAPNQNVYVKDIS